MKALFEAGALCGTLDLSIDCPVIFVYLSPVVHHLTKRVSSCSRNNYTGSQNFDDFPKKNYFAALMSGQYIDTIKMDVPLMHPEDDKKWSNLWCLEALQ